jgi:hypothetical protein
MRSLRLASLVIAGLMIVPAWGARSSSADDQDACRIGAVSPEEYQAIAAEVAARPTVDWQEIHNDPFGTSEDLEDVVAAAIRDRIEDAIASREISDQKIAAMHAVMRSMGAEFAWVDLSSQPVSSYVHQPAPGAVYHYRINVNRLGVLRPVFRWGRIDVVFNTDESWQTLSGLRRVIFHFPHPFSPSLAGLEQDIPMTGPCPPVPAEAERPVRNQEPAGDATPSSEQPPDRETVPQGPLEPLDDAALRRALYGNYVERE